MKDLVAFFSASGVTAAVAENLARILNADLYEIEPQEKYTNKDLNWMDKNSRSSVEMRNKSFRPAIVDKPLDVAKYDSVFLGFPIWWYVAPTVVNTFLEKYDFSGKKIVLFATSGGSRFGNTLKELLPSAPQANFTEGSIINGRVSDEKLQKFIDSIG